MNEWRDNTIDLYAELIRKGIDPSDLNLSKSEEWGVAIKLIGSLDFDRGPKKVNQEKQTRLFE